MIQKLFKSFAGMPRRQDGAITVEMALILPLFLLIAAGILDFGHAWFMRQAITNASREGARYGITYKTNTSGVRIPPNALSPTIQTKVNTYLTNLLPSDANPTVTCRWNWLFSGKSFGTALKCNCLSYQEMVAHIRLNAIFRLIRKY